MKYANLCVVLSLAVLSGCMYPDSEPFQPAKPFGIKYYQPLPAFMISSPDKDGNQTFTATSLPDLESPQTLTTSGFIGSIDLKPTFNNLGILTSIDINNNPTANLQSTVSAISTAKGLFAPARPGTKTTETAPEKPIVPPGLYMLKVTPQHKYYLDGPLPTGFAP